jgi:hypothetical protein
MLTFVNKWWRKYCYRFMRYNIQRTTSKVSMCSLIIKRWKWPVTYLKASRATLFASTDRGFRTSSKLTASGNFPVNHVTSPHLIQRA